ncbi:MAG: hypothetical protein R3285_07325 [Kiloniellales bacterium]|nr:hypothetical protein [Kiloniellales bacterium]
MVAVLGLFGGPDAGAQETGMVLWDRHVAVTMNEALLSDDVCRAGPYRLYRQTCVGNELNITLDREDRHNTLLDHLAITIHRYRYLNMNRDLGRGAKFKVRAKLSNLYKQEAEVRVSLRVPF